MRCSIVETKNLSHRYQLSTRERRRGRGSRSDGLDVYLDANMGEKPFSSSGSGADGQFTGSGKIHIVLKHTPK
jgi:hypothetical protein